MISAIESLQPYKSGSTRLKVKGQGALLEHRN